MRDKDTYLLEESYANINEIQQLKNFTIEQILAEGQFYLDGGQFNISNKQVCLEEGYGSALWDYVSAPYRSGGIADIGAKAAEVTEPAIQYMVGLKTQFLASLKVLGIGAAAGAGLAQLIAWLMHRAVKKIIEEAEKIREIEIEPEQIKYDARKQKYIDMINNGEDVSPEELKQSKEELISAIEKITEKTNIKRVKIANIVDKIADTIGGIKGTAVFAVAGAIVAKLLTGLIG